MSNTTNSYGGDKLKRAVEFLYQGEKFRIDPYLPSDKLRQAVHLAQVLGRPLLLKGEPGCGKTRLAEAVAYELFGENFPDHYIEWPVKSSSKAQDGLYVIDHLQRLRDASVRQERAGGFRQKGAGSLAITLTTGRTKGQYVELGPLGKAFQLTTTTDAALPPPVVLIDEIDKADIDFPNDLLLELDKMEFTIPEAVNEKGRPVKIKADRDKKPLIIITSNDEKPLPAAFLRRCLFHYIKFPEPEDLERIVSAKWPDLDKQLITSATLEFQRLRDAIQEAGTTNRNISTSELLDWVTLIVHHQGKDLPNLDTLPFEEALIKDMETLQVFLKRNEKRS